MHDRNDALKQANARLTTPDRVADRSPVNVLLGLLGVAGIVFLFSVFWEFLLADFLFASSADEDLQLAAGHKWLVVLKVTTYSVVAFSIIFLVRNRFFPELVPGSSRSADAEMRYSSIVKAEPQCVKLMDRAGKLLDMNPAGLSIIAAQNFEEVRGFDVQELVVPTHRPAFNKLLTDVFEGNSGELEFQITALDGERKWMRTHAVPLFDAEGEVSTYMAVTHDITEKKRVDEELIVAKDEAETANRQMSIFLANVSHEFRTPLNAIVGFTQMMRSEMFGPIGNEKYSDYLCEVEKAGMQLSVVVEDLLDTSTLAAGGISLNISAVDLVEQLESVSLMLAQKSAEKNLRITKSVEFERCMVRVDEVRLRQIITNLLDNAIKFTSDGGSINCSITGQEDGAIELCVSDTGIGIEPHFLPNATKPFRRADGAYTRSHKGSGLGLALVSEFSKLQGAAFEIESEVGVGTKARVIFPCDHVIEVTPVVDD